jgi:hypothetical protein
MVSKLPVGHLSIQTTERYPVSEQEIEIAVNARHGRFFDLSLGYGFLSVSSLGL